MLTGHKVSKVWACRTAYCNVEPEEESWKDEKLAETTE
jgi:hypothetical protein